jgi:acetyl-CoA carboxylase biotin carboxylase subunit
MFKKILIANRGEIAVRIIRACKEMGIISAAIYSDADKTCLHTILADEAYYIGESPPISSYLNQDKIINLAKEINADAIHPGYGFLSENDEFIKKVETSQIVFIGPSSQSVALMGKKTSARELMIKNGVPIIPGTISSITSLKDGLRSAKEIGYPVLLKASAGGGGKGMRKVYSPDEFKDSFEAAQREALKAFSDDSIYIEKLIENPRHIEVQIIGDKYGNYVHLFERECSIQRRHQKIIEETPSVFIDESIREKITTAALNSAKACDYFNAGTIEFLMDDKRNFYFLEMNTRLQVEHPVTEMITGIDIVKEQISIALDNKLSFNQNEIKIIGHSIECRIYAEDPDNNFLPTKGRIYDYKQPSGFGVRVDEGFIKDSEVSIYYDPIIAKLICWSNTRDNALAKMRTALDEYYISGITTNINYLKSIIENEKFINGDFDINFIEREREYLNSKPEDQQIDIAAAIFSAILKSQSFQKDAFQIRTANHIKNRWTEQFDE